MREVRSGFDCGMSLANYGNIVVGDVLSASRWKKLQRVMKPLVSHLLIFKASFHSQSIG